MVIRLIDDFFFTISPGQFSVPVKKNATSKKVPKTTGTANCKNTLMKSPILEACAYGQLDTIEHLLEVSIF